MEQRNLSVELIADVTTYTRRVLSFEGQEWSPTADGAVWAELLDPLSGQATRELIHRGALDLVEEDFSRGATLSVRYRYLFGEAELRQARQRLIDFLARLGEQGWAVERTIAEVRQGYTLDANALKTYPQWGVQVQYLGGRVTTHPKAGAYTSVIFTDRLYAKRET